MEEAFDYPFYTFGNAYKERYVVDINFSSDELWAREIESWISVYIFEEGDSAYGFVIDFIERMEKRKKYELAKLFSHDNGMIFGALYKNGDESVRIMLECQPVNDSYYRKFRYKGKNRGRLRFV